MPAPTVSEKEQWANSSITRSLKEALLAHREELKEAWATGALQEGEITHKSLGAIENIDSTLSAIDDLSREEKPNEQF